MPPDPNGGPGGPSGVLFVCTGNICRSPTAEALARRELDRHQGTPIQLVKTMAVGPAGPT
jgi:protein-tyrosine-phosphatase